MCNSHILSHKCTLPGKLYGACKRRIDRTAFFNAVEDSCHASLVALQDRRWWWLDLSNLSKTKLVSLERYVLSSSWSTHTDLRRKRPCRRSRRRRWLSRIRRLCVTSCTSPKACRRRRLLANAANGSLNSKTLNRKLEILACLVLAVVLECEILHPTTLESYILSLKS